MVRIALIICARNRRHEIERSMTSALVSGIQKLIVVDSFSTDSTVEIARHLADGVISDEGKGPASSRQVSTCDMKGLHNLPRLRHGDSREALLQRD